jgi:hypothetical protein
MLLLLLLLCVVTIVFKLRSEYFPATKGDRLDLLTRKIIIRRTGAPTWLVDYLKANNRLPLAKDSTGSGNPVIFKPEALDIVIAHLERNSRSV